MEREHRVTYGGLFHSHKVQYSKETQNLLNRLIEESKLSILQRQALKNSVKNGEPLPGPERGNSASKGRGQGMTGRGEVLVPPALPRRRSYQAIVRSGAYQRDTFHPPYNSNMKDREEEKQKLQSLMTYGKNLPPDPSSLKTSRLKQRAEEEEFDADTLFDHFSNRLQTQLFVDLGRVLEWGSTHGLTKLQPLRCIVSRVCECKMGDQELNLKLVAEV
ncbi:hypothetical protein J6590_005065 [Homalodisca vitripennis]|nr:hypothetical protein J6590_005065 [Homalodisca vitripennis]